MGFDEMLCTHWGKTHERWRFKRIFCWEAATCRFWSLLHPFDWTWLEMVRGGWRSASNSHSMCTLAESCCPAKSPQHQLTTHSIESQNQYRARYRADHPLSSMGGVVNSPQVWRRGPGERQLWLVVPLPWNKYESEWKLTSHLLRCTQQVDFN